MQIDAFQGVALTPCVVFFDGPWYCIKGDTNVYRTSDEECLVIGIVVNDLRIVDGFNNGDPIESVAELVTALST